MKYRVRKKIAKRWCEERGVDYERNISGLVRWNGSPWWRWTNRYRLIRDLEDVAGYLATKGRKP